jgi:hypothetical protein
MWACRRAGGKWVRAAARDALRLNADVTMESAFGELATKPPPPPGLVLVHSQLSGPTLAHEKSFCVWWAKPARSSRAIAGGGPTSVTTTVSTDPPLSRVDAPSPAQGWELFALQSGTSAAESYNRRLTTKRAARFLFSI